MGSLATPRAARALASPVRMVVRSTTAASGLGVAACSERKSASLPDCYYSGALKSANIVWNEETLDKWLTDPQAFAPDAKMFFHLDSAQDRAKVIASPKERSK